ncbi:hypothetical protein Tco_0842572, partial [Tanacetum coccineum]
MEIKSHSYYGYGSFKSFICWQINPTEGGEDSVSSSSLDAVADVQTSQVEKATSGDSSRVLIDDSTRDVSYGTPEDGNTDRAGDRSDTKKVSITGSNKPKLSEAEDFALSNHDTGKLPSNESQRNTTNHSVVISDSSATDYDSADESSVCSTPLPPLEKLTGPDLNSKAVNESQYR